MTSAQEHARAKTTEHARDVFAWLLQVCEDRELINTASRWAILLAKFWNPQEQGAWPSHRTLASMLGMDHSASQRIAKSLETRGHLVIHKRAGNKGSNFFEPVLKPGCEKLWSEWRKRCNPNDGAKMHPNVSQPFPASKGAKMHPPLVQKCTIPGGKNAPSPGAKMHPNLILSNNTTEQHYGSNAPKGAVTKVEVGAPKAPPYYSAAYYSALKEKIESLFEEHGKAVPTDIGCVRGWLLCHWGENTILSVLKARLKKVDAKPLTSLREIESEIQQLEEF